MCKRYWLTQLFSCAAVHFGRVVAILRFFVIDEAIGTEQVFFFALDIALVVSAKSTSISISSWIWKT